MRQSDRVITTAQQAAALLFAHDKQIAGHMLREALLSLS